MIRKPSSQHIGVVGSGSLTNIMSTEEASVNTDGTSSFDETTGSPPVNTPGGEEFEDAIPPTIDGEEILKAAAPQVDPAVYFLIVVIILAALYYFFVYRKKSLASEDDFFAELDGDKVSLPACSWFALSDLFHII